MKKMQCIGTTRDFDRYGYKVGEVYEVDETRAYAGDDIYWLVTIPFCPLNGEYNLQLWFPKIDFIDLPDVKTCMKCGITDPMSDENTLTDPCANNNHEWLGGDQ